MTTGSVRRSRSSLPALTWQLDMANAERGEVAVKAGDREITLVLDFNALCALEEACGSAVEDMDFSRPSLGLMRRIMWAAMQRYQPETTAEAAGDAIDAIGLQPAMDLLGRLLSRTAPEAATGKQGKAKRANG